MKVIDLLNKLVNDEEVPKTIQLFIRIYKYCEDIKDYEAEDSEYYCLIRNFIESCDDLNEEVKIIEDTPKEDKEYIEHLKMQENELHNHLNIIDKINEIIDHLNVEK